jgi:phage gp46-like protein
MPDIRLVAIDTPDIITFDWLRTPSGQLDETQEFATAVLIALNSDALADQSDVLPDPRDSNRRGWWGDLDAARIWNGWPLGSKLWLLTRAKIVGSKAREGATTARVDAYLRAALNPFITAGLCSEIAVSTTVVSPSHMRSRIRIYRGPKTAIELEYQAAWTEMFPGS